MSGNYVLKKYLCKKPGISWNFIFLNKNHENAGILNKIHVKSFLIQFYKPIINYYIMEVTKFNKKPYKIHYNIFKLFKSTYFVLTLNLQ